MLFCCLVGISTAGIERYRPVDPNTVYCPRGFPWNPEPTISNYPYDGPQPGLCPLHRLAGESAAAAYQQEQEQERERREAGDAAMALMTLPHDEHLEVLGEEQEDAILGEAQVDEELEVEELEVEELEVEELEVEELEVDTEVQPPRTLGVAEQYMAILRDSGRAEAEHWLRWRQDMNF